VKTRLIGAYVGASAGAPLGLVLALLVVFLTPRLPWRPLSHGAVLLVSLLGSVAVGAAVGLFAAPGVFSRKGRRLDDAARRDG
jgi:hypothetical protein